MKVCHSFQLTWIRSNTTKVGTWSAKCEFLFVDGDVVLQEAFQDLPFSLVVLLNRRVSNKHIIYSTTSMKLARPSSAISSHLQNSSVETNPMSLLRNIYLPQGVINVVRGWESFSRGIYEYHNMASNVEKTLAPWATCFTAAQGDRNRCTV